MKKTLVLSICLLLLSTLSFAQIIEIGVSFGAHQDVYSNMSMNFIRDLSLSDEAFKVDLTSFEEETYAYVDGTILSGFVHIERPSINERVSKEWVIGARAILDREAMVSWHRPVVEDGIQYQDSYVFCIIDNEFGLSGAHLWRKDGRFFSAYTGLGANLGVTFNPEFLRISQQFPDFSVEQEIDPASNEDRVDIITYQARHSGYARVMVPVGVQAHILKKAVFGVEWMGGTGVHQAFGGDTYHIRFSHNVTLRLGYNFVR
ncbi:MAG: hypothetical protein MK081_11685 [Flavobacteriales bacterium]|nr:hypothetical protein [Flavobacteriales bacterium]